MTMQYPVHPDDERLAALAGDDPQAIGDAGLTEHVAGCDRCAGVADELRLLRSLLAELPDLRPSRPIQLIPPVPAAGSAGGGPFGWLRGLAAPAMVAGAGLALVGAVGFGGTVLGGMASGAGAPAPDAIEGGRGDSQAFESVSQAPATAADPSAPPAAGSAEDGRDGDEYVAPININLNTPGTWAVVLLVGMALLVGGMVLRFTLQPRAG
jgi:hypothetical protein